MNPQISELLIAYAVTALAMLVGLATMRADGRAYWRWPVYSAMVMVLGVVLWNLARKHLLPAGWAIEYPAVLYFSALGAYAALGLGCGFLLGRLTRRTTAGSEP